MNISDKANKVHGVYIIFDEKTDKTYIGSSNNIELRRINHENALKRNAHYNTHLQNLYNKRGTLSFVYCETETREVAYDFEQAVIDEYKDSKLLLNIATDARRHGGGRIPGPETRAKMSAWQIGKKHSPETIAKLKEIAKGRSFPKEALEKAKEVNRERIKTEEEKYKTAKSKFIPVEAESRVFESLTDAATAFGINVSSAFYRVTSPNFPDWFYLNEFDSPRKYK